MLKSRILLVLKGIAMGGADVVPGVSGGTIALITGIYEQLINSIKSVDQEAFLLLIKGNFKAFWAHIGGTFLVTLFAGIFISLFSLAKLITYLMENHPIPLWSFFFGLLVISAYYVMPFEKNWKIFVTAFLAILFAYWITTLTAADTPTDAWFIVLSGAIAICAMILPGISGSFILLLLGKYEYILNALETLDIGVLALFMVGCVLGLLAFSKLIHWLLNQHKSITMAALAGFMLGSLNKIWPWKTGEGELINNISPAAYTAVTGQPNQLYLAIICFVFGIAIVLILEKLGKKLA